MFISVAMGRWLCIKSIVRKIITLAYIMYYLNPITSRLSLLLHESEAEPRTSVNNNDNLLVVGFKWLLFHAFDVYDHGFCA